AGIAARSGPAASMVPPRGLPQATARRRLSPVGRDTGPAAAPDRMASEPAFVHNPPEVRAAGAMVPPREARRAVPQRSARAVAVDAPSRSLSAGPGASGSPPSAVTRRPPDFFERSTGHS